MLPGDPIELNQPVQTEAAQADDVPKVEREELTGSAAGRLADPVGPIVVAPRFVDLITGDRHRFDGAGATASDHVRFVHGTPEGLRIRLGVTQANGAR